MANITDSSLILLTYKSKILLKLHDSNPEILDNPTNTVKNSWSFISCYKEKNKSFKDSILAKVEKKTGIQLKTVDFLLDITYEEKSKHFFHARLTDDNVNNMTRMDGITLQFFTIKELSKLNLTPLTREFVDNNAQILDSLHQS